VFENVVLNIWLLFILTTGYGRGGAESHTFKKDANAPLPAKTPNGTTVAPTRATAEETSD
jgi:hypothetical protein